MQNVFTLALYFLSDDLLLIKIYVLWLFYLSYCRVMILFLKDVSEKKQKNTSLSLSGRFFREMTKFGLAHRVAEKFPVGRSYRATVGNASSMRTYI